MGVLKPNINRKLQFAYGSAILILLALGAACFLSIVSARESELWVIHTHEVIEKLQDLLYSMRSVESNDRGYGLTGDEADLASYRTALLSLRRSAADVGGLTVDNPLQQRQLPALNALIDQKIEFANKIMRVRRAGGSKAAVEAIQTEDGIRVMDATILLVGEMQREEIRLLAQRNENAVRRLLIAEFILALNTLLAVSIALFAAGAALRLKREGSRRELAEKALISSDDKYRGLLEAAPDAMVVVNQRGEIVLLNAQAELQFGYRRDELLGQRVAAIIPVGFAERLISDGKRTAAEALLQQIGTGIELDGLRKDGSKFPIEMMLSPLENADGILVTAAIRNITKRRRAEEAQLDSDEKYRGLLEAAPDAMVVVNQQGEIVLLNAQAELQFGYRRDELQGQKITNIIPLGFAERLISDEKRTAAEALLQQIGTGIELDGLRKDGSEFPVEMMLSPLENSDGILVTAAIRNIAARRKAAARLASTVEELERSNSELQRLAFVSSHDLQEPLRTVTSYAQLLSKRYKGRLDAEADEFITFVVSGCFRMKELIQDLLAFSRAGTDERSQRQEAVEDALQGALTNLGSAIRESLAVITHDPLPTIVTNGAELVQVFQNLIGNAIKYRSGTPPRIHVSASQRVAIPGQGSEWVLSVQDNGIGIESQYFDKIFVLFQRLHGPGEFSGTGVGLAICKKIVERLGGRMWVESELGKGSTFSFALPAGVAK